MCCNGWRCTPNACRGTRPVAWRASAHPAAGAATWTQHFSNWLCGWVMGIPCTFQPTGGRQAAGIESPAQPLGELWPAVRGVPHLVVNGYPVIDPTAAGRDATALRALWSRAVMAGACGVMVDLSGNGGGNMYPMLAGLLPLWPDGPLFGFEDRLGARAWVERRDGAIWFGGAPAFTAIPSAPLPPPRRVAVLVGARPARARWWRWHCAGCRACGCLVAARRG